MIVDRDDLGGDTGDDQRDDVTRDRVAPGPAVDAERDEADVARAEEHGQRREEEPALLRPSEPAEHQHVGDEEDDAGDDEVGEHLEQPPRLDGERMPEARVARLSRPRPLAELAEKRAELHEQHEGEQDADRRSRPACRGRCRPPRSRRARRR